MIILHTFGTASIEITDSVIVTPNARRRFAVLLYLAVERDREISREQLANLVFGDRSPAKNAHGLREIMYELRRLGAPVVSRQRVYMMSADDVRSDYDDALRTPVIGDDVMGAMAGGFLPACEAPPNAESYSEWLDTFRAEQSGALSRRMLAQMDDAMRAARWEPAERAARACIGLDPWNERATFALAELLATGGSKAAALQLLDRYIAEFGPQWRELAARASALRRLIGAGMPAALGAGSRSGVDALGRGTPRLVGREAEMAGLLGALEQTNAGESQCVVVAGEAGIGKTRLAGDFSAIASLRAAHVERVTIQPHDGDRPMGAFVDLVPALLNTRGAAGCSPDSMGALRSLTGKQAGSADAAHQIAGAEEHEQRWSAVSRAVVDLCEAIATEQTLVLVIEDAHWLDVLSANTIGKIVGTKRKARIMVIATTRDPRVLVREIRLTERCRTIALAPLAPGATDELLDIVLPPPEKVVREKRPGEGTEAIRSRIASISAGNPLFLISLAAHSRAHRGPFQVPGTIVETFAQRIDGLSWRGLSVLATCAELGKHSTIKRLVRALEMRKHEMVESLLELTDAGLVLRDGQNAVPAHPLVAEALRSRLAEPARRAVAHSVAGALEEEAQSGQSPALWWDVAASWRMADNADKTLGALQQCARHTLEMGRPGEAARILSEAAALPQSKASRVRVAESMMDSARAAAEYPLVLHAAELLRSAGRDQRHDDIEITEIHALFAVNQSYEEVAERVQACLRDRQATADHRVQAAIALLKCADATGRKDLRDAALSYTSDLDLSEIDVRMRLEFDILAASVVGDRETAATIARALVGECRSLEGRESVSSRHYLTAALALCLAGYEAESIDTWEHVFALSEKQGSYRSMQLAAIRLADAYFDAGQDIDGGIWLNRAVAIGVERPELAKEFGVTTAIIEFEIFNGRLDNARILVDNLRALWERTNPVTERWIKAADAAIESGYGQLTEASRDRLLALGRDTLNSMTGIRDFEVAVATEALMRLGLAQDAVAVLGKYLETEKTIPKPPTRLLARAIQTTIASCEPLTSGWLAKAWGSPRRVSVQAAD